MFYCCFLLLTHLINVLFYNLRANPYPVIHDSVISIPNLFIFFFGNALYKEVFLLGYFLHRLCSMALTQVASISLFVRCTPSLSRNMDLLSILVLGIVLSVTYVYIERV